VAGIDKTLLNRLDKMVYHSRNDARIAMPPALTVQFWRGLFRHGGGCTIWTITPQQVRL
jgi:hypothetical protein